MTYSIRAVAQAELPDLLALNEAELPHLGSVDLEQLRWFAEHASCFRTAISAGKPAAFVIGLRPGTSYKSPNYLWFCENFADFLYIDRIAVAPSHRRRGLGRRLYADVMASMTGVVPVLTCEVNLRPPNPGSMQFHEALGFEKVGEQETGNGAKTVALLARSL